jgi:hypothetical protein
VVRHGQLLDQGRLEGDVPDAVHPPRVHHDLLTQPSPAAGRLHRGSPGPRTPYARSISTVLALGEYEGIEVDCLTIRLQSRLGCA